MGDGRILRSVAVAGVFFATVSPLSVALAPPPRERLTLLVAAAQ